MKGKRIFYCELAYLVGILVLALGTALMELADFGMSMIVAPAYLIHLKLSQWIPFFSFGMSEYLVQAVLLAVLSLIMGRMKKGYLLSFATAVIYGILLDLMMSGIALLPFEGMVWRSVCFLLGMLACTTGVSLLFFTYLPPEAYELFVKELSQKFNLSIYLTKKIYDGCSCALSILLSLCFFGGFVGIHWGTVVCAILNGWFIEKISHFLEKRFTFQDAFPLREELNG